MGKQGPCCHCGIATTPLWRNGPAEKPVLCNACGSRWRTKGTLVNYMPMHSGGLGLKSSSTKKGTQKINEHHSLKRKEPSDGLLDLYGSYQRADPNRSMLHEEDACTRSSTGSGMSYSESCAQRTVTTGRASECWPPWGCHVPSKRRSVMLRHRPSANRLSYSFPRLDHRVINPSSEDNLLVEYKPSSMSVEIGLGGVFIRPPAYGVPAQESQASSLMCEKKEVKQSVTLESDVTRVGILGVPLEGSSKHRGKDKMKQFGRTNRAVGNGSAKSWIPNKTLLENFPYNKRDVLQSCHSPLVFVELKDIINSDTFMGLLTEQEQHQLMKHLSPADLKPDSLKCMFSSAQFESALRGFQDLLSGGMFDSLESGVSLRVLQHYQQLLTISDFTTSGWMERCSQMRKRKSSGEYAKIMQGKEYLKEKLKGLSTVGADVLSSSTDVAVTKSLPAGNLGSVITEVDETPDSSAPSTRGQNSPSMSHVTFGRDRQPAERQRRNSFKTYGFEGEGRNKPNLGSKTHYSAHQGRKVVMEAPSYGLLEHDLLLDLPSTLSFQQAELLHQPVRLKSPPKEAEILASQSSKTGNAPIQDNNWPCEPNMDWSEFLWNSPSAGSVNDTF
eukprot:c21782_g1_i1 orf=388-2229(+)